MSQTELSYAWTIPRLQIVFLNFHKEFLKWSLCISQFQTWPPPRAKPQGNFLDGRIPLPQGKERVQNSHPRAYKNELKPRPRGHYPELFTINTWKNETEIM